MENVDVGLGLGLSAQLNDAQGLARMTAQAEQNRLRIAAQKAEQEGQDYRRLMDDLVENGKFKQHRLVIDEAMKTSQEAIDKAIEARNSGDPNWRNRIYTIRNQYNNKMSELSALSATYSQLDKLFTPSAERNLFVADDVRKFQNIYNTAKNREDLVAKAKQLGLTQSNYVAVQDSGLVDVVMPSKMDVLGQLAQDGKLLPQFTQTFNITKEGGGTSTRQVMAPFAYREQALESIKGKPDGTPEPPSVESMIEQRMMMPGFKEQFAASIGVDPKNDDAIKEAMFNEVFAKTRYTDTRRWWQERKGTNVFVNTAPPASGSVGDIVLGSVYPIPKTTSEGAFPVLSYNANFNLDYTLNMNDSYWRFSSWNRVTESGGKVVNPSVSSIEILPVDAAGQPLRAKFEESNRQISYDPQTGKPKIVGYLSNGNGKIVTPASYKTFYRLGEANGSATYLVPTNKLTLSANNIQGGKETVSSIQSKINQLDEYARKMSTTLKNKSVYEIQDLYTNKQL